MFEWSEEYRLGIGTVDAQHQTLFAVGAELAAAVKSGQGESRLAKTLDRLTRYVQSHFAHEERLMLLHAYPGYEAHRLAHERLAAQVKGFELEFRTGREALSERLLPFLETWLEKHIRGEDARFAPYMPKRLPG